MARQSSNKAAYGENAWTQSQVDAWLDFSNNELDSEIFALVFPILGVIPFDGETNNSASSSLEEKFTVINKILSKTTFIVGDHLTIADFALVSIILLLFRTVYDENKRNAFPQLAKWVQTVAENEAFKFAFGKTRFVKTSMKPAPSKDQKEKKEKTKEQ